MEVKSQPSCALEGITLTERGQITSVYSRSFVAGALPEHVSFKLKSKYFLDRFCSINKQIAFIICEHIRIQNILHYY